MIDAHNEFMAEAIAEALKGLNTVTPNPRVGCLIVSQHGDIIGRGYHQQAGQAHAEVNALLDAGSDAQGATAYVSLEPCCHHGRTGPCVQALIAAGIARVVYGMKDPNPEMSGQGLQLLNEANIEVVGPVLESQAREMNKGFISRMERQRPWVRCKMAMSLDGRTAMANGQSQWITGELARADVQRLRALSCAIITGADSVLQDNPAMTVRAPEFGRNPRQPRRFVIDSKQRVTGQEKIFMPPGEAFIVRTSGLGAEEKSKASILAVARQGQYVDLLALLQTLSRQGVNEVLLETGASLAGAFLSAGLIDELIVYMAGKVMGSSARPLFDLPLTLMSEAYPIAIDSVERVGEDWKITAYPSGINKNQ